MKAPNGIRLSDNRVFYLQLLAASNAALPLVRVGLQVQDEGVASDVPPIGCTGIDFPKNQNETIFCQKARTDEWKCAKKLLMAGSGLQPEPTLFIYVYNHHQHN